MKSKININKYDLFLVLFVVFAALILRLIFLSPWLEDWDSVQFALALKDFSIVKHQPHSPGYPLYILLARIFNLFLKNDTLALTSLSAFLGSFSTIPLYLLIKDIVNKKIALLSSIIFLVTPIHWNLSEVALSNIPGMFFSISSVYLLFKGRNSLKMLLWGSFLSGLTLGVRFAEYSTVIVLLGFILLVRKKLSDSVKSIFYFVMGTLVWLIPLILDTGFKTFVLLYKNQIGYILNHDSLFIQSSSLIERLMRIKWLFIIGYSPYFLATVLIAAIYLLVKNRKIFKNTNLLFILVWIISYLVPLFFIYNLEVPRHVLPLLPPLIILFAISLKNLWKWKIIKLYCIVTITLLFSVALKEVQLIHTLTPPTVAPVLYVKDNFDPKEIVLVTTFTYRHFQYYAPEFINYWGNINNPEIISANKVIIDYLKLVSEIPSLVKYKIKSDKKFSGPINIFPRQNNTSLYILEKNN